MLPKIVIAIDDEPIRYDSIRTALSRCGIVLINTCRVEEFTRYISGDYDIVGVFLDHDMPFQNGIAFSHILKEKNYKVSISSLNFNGANEMYAILNEYEVDVILNPVTNKDCFPIAFDFFKIT